jgi:hypothetical protein
MIRRCEPLYEGDTAYPRCGQFYDDLDHSTICPHLSLEPWVDNPVPAEAILAYLAMVDGYLTECGLGSPAR